MKNKMTDYDYYKEQLERNLPIDEYPIHMKIGNEGKYINLNRTSLKALNDFYNEHKEEIERVYNE